MSAQPPPTQPQPNAEQQQALDDFLKFLLGPEEAYHLVGAAGTGKTFVLRRFKSEVYPRYLQGCDLIGLPPKYEGVLFTATTNKAAEVLSKSISVFAKTIHNALGLRVYNDETSGKTRIKPTRNTNIIKNMIIVIDEASMIDKELFSLIQRYTHDCKYIYVSDHCQLAPVFEKKSKIYNNQKFFSELKTPMRNQGNKDLMELCAQYRNTVKTGLFEPIEEKLGSIEYVDGLELEELIQTTFSELDADARILCYTNRTVQAFNQYIRQFRNLPKHFTKGERLICASAHTMPTRLSIEQEVEVVDVDLNPYTVLQSSPYEVEMYSVTITKDLHTGLGDPDLHHKFLVPVNPAQFRRAIRVAARHKSWSEYFHLKDNYPDLRPKEACTVYKAQGSTYHTVFIDLDDICTCTDAQQAARMLYVAVSRPTDKIYLIGGLKPKFGGYDVF